MKFGELIDLVNMYQSLERTKTDMEGHPPTSIFYKDILQKIEELREMELIDGEFVKLEVPNVEQAVCNKLLPSIGQTWEDITRIDNTTLSPTHVYLAIEAVSGLLTRLYYDYNLSKSSDALILGEDGTVKISSYHGQTIIAGSGVVVQEIIHTTFLSYEVGEKLLPWMVNAAKKQPRLFANIECSVTAMGNISVKFTSQDAKDNYLTRWEK